MKLDPVWIGPKIGIRNGRGIGSLEFINYNILRE